MLHIKNQSLNEIVEELKSLSQNVLPETVLFLAEFFIKNNYKQSECLYEIEELFNKNSPILEQADVYFSFKKHQKLSENIEKFQQEERDQVVQIFIDSILNIEPSDRDSAVEMIQIGDVFYDKICELILFKLLQYSDYYKEISQLKQDQKDNVIKQVQQILPKEELYNYLLLEDIKKIQHIDDLVLVVMGLQLFKQSMVDQSDSYLKKIISNNDVYSKQINSILEQLSNLKSNDFDQEVIKNVQQQILLEIKEEQLLISEGMRLDMSVYAQQIEQLQEMIAENPKIIKVKIYPILKQIASTYQFIFAYQNKQLRLNEFIQKFIQRDSIIDLQQSISANQEDYQNQLNFKMKDYLTLVNQENCENFFELSLQFGGYCPVSLVDQQKLILADLSLGIVQDRRDNKNYGFKDIFHMNKYFDKKEIYDLKIEDMHLDNMNLTFLLDNQFFQKMPELSYHFEKIGSELFNKKYDEGIQTDTHFQERLIDRNYYWNEWDLRRMAIKMVNIRNMATIGSQTQTSLFRVDNQTQVWAQKEESTMTGVEDGNNPIWPKNYIVGLRHNENITTGTST